jgi:hypothetical protein
MYPSFVDMVASVAGERMVSALEALGPEAAMKQEMAV